MIIGFGGLIENGKDGIYGFRKSFGRVCIAEKDTGAGVIEIERRQAKLWDWETWFWMWTTRQIIVADLIVRGPDEFSKTLGVPTHNVRVYLPFVLPLWSDEPSPLGEWEEEREWVQWGRRT